MILQKVLSFQACVVKTSSERDTSSFNIEEIFLSCLHLHAAPLDVYAQFCRNLNVDMHANSFLNVTCFALRLEPPRGRGRGHERGRGGPAKFLRVFGYWRVRVSVQDWAKRLAPGCVNASGKGGRSDKQQQNKIHQTWGPTFSLALHTNVGLN